MHAKEQALRLRKLIAAGVLVLPNAWTRVARQGDASGEQAPLRTGCPATDDESITTVPAAPPGRTARPHRPVARCGRQDCIGTNSIER